MKLLKIKRLELIPKKNKLVYKIRLHIIIIFLLFPSLVFSQQYFFHFNNAKLSEALKEVSEKMQFSIAFDSKALSQIIVNGDFSGNNQSEILSKLISGTNFSIERKYGNYLIVPSVKIDSKPNVYQVNGVVSDLVSGELLPYANIYFPEQNSYLTASVNGSFSFNIHGISSLRVNIQYMGYNSSDSIYSLSDSIVNLNIKLKQRNLMLESVDVKKIKSKMIDQTNVAGNSTINPFRFDNLPNMGENDIFRTVQLLPGIIYNENSSGLNIRGGSADQNLVLFDGFTLYNLDHFFGTFSSINSNVVKDIQIFKGGFDSRYGERLSGVIDITGKTGNKYDTKIYGGLNLVSGNLTAELPISDKVNLVIAGRRSYADIYSSFLFDKMIKNQATEVEIANNFKSIVELEPGYYFYDYNSKLTFSPNEFEKVSLSLFGAKDYLSSKGEGRTKQLFSSTTDDSEWSNYGLSFSWLKQWQNIFSNLQVGYSGYNNSYESETEVTSYRLNRYIIVADFFSSEKNELNDFSVLLRNTINFNLKNTFEFGVQAKYNRFDYVKNAGTDSYYADLNNSAWFYSTYLQLNSRLTEKLNVKLGSRISSYTQVSKLFTEPRLNANFLANENLNFKLAVGRYYQFLSKISPTQAYGYNRDFWVLADGAKHPVLSSNHFIIGSTFDFGNFSLDAEFYYKTIDGQQLFLYIPQFQKNADPGSFTQTGQARKILPNKFISGSGKALGLDLLLKYESAYYTSWLSYSRSEAKSKFPEINNNNEIPAPYEKADELKFTNMLSYRKWNFSGMIIYSSGQPYIVSQTVNRNLKATFVYDRLPDFSRVDISANYNMVLGKVGIKLGASIINLLNTVNYNDIYSRDFNFDTTLFNETTYLKSLGITPNFFISFNY